MLYYLSDGIYGSFNNVIFDHAHPNPNQVIQRAGGMLLIEFGMIGAIVILLIFVSECVYGIV